MPQFVLGFYSYFSGIPLYDSYIYQLYNLIFTSIPIIIYGIFDKDAYYKRLENDVRMYFIGMRSLNFSLRKIVITIGSGILQGIIILLGSVFLLECSFYKDSQIDIYSIGSIIYFICVIVVNLRLFFISGEITILSAMSIILSIFSYIITIFIFNNKYSLDIFGTFLIYFHPLVIIFLFVICSFCLLIDNFIGKVFWLIFYGVIKDA